MAYIGRYAVVLNSETLDITGQSRMRMKGGTDEGTLKFYRADTNLELLSHDGCFIRLTGGVRETCFTGTMIGPTSFRETGPL